MRKSPDYGLKRLKKLLKDARSSSYDAETLLHWTVDRDNCMRCVGAMYTINKYLFGARIQVQRIGRSLKTLQRSESRIMEQGITGAWHRAMTQCMLDIHFYFTCWNTIQKMMELLKSISGFKSVGEVYKRHRWVLEHYGEARDHMEHYEERLPGGKRNRTLSNPSDLGNLSPSEYSLGGNKWNITATSLGQLEEIVSQLNENMKKEGMVRYRRMREQGE